MKVVWSTGAAVPRRDYEGPVHRSPLALAGACSAWDALNGAAVLDTHARYSLRDVLGVVIDAGIDKGEGWATVKFSARSEVASVWAGRPRRHHSQCQRRLHGREVGGVEGRRRRSHQDRDRLDPPRNLFRSPAGRCRRHSQEP